MAALALRSIVSFAVVLGLMIIAAKVMRNRAISAGRIPGEPVTVEIIGRAGLTRNASIVVARAGGKALVLGVTDSSVTMLAEADVASTSQPMLDLSSNASSMPETPTAADLTQTDLTQTDLTHAPSKHGGLGADWTALPGSEKRSGQPRKGFLETMRERTVRR